MKLNTKTRYGLRMLFQLALNYDKGTLQLNEIARREDISEKYLEQIVSVLRSAGLVVSQRGAQGGYSLAREPEKVPLSEIVEKLEGGLNIMDCLEDTRCSNDSRCVARNVWKKVNDAMVGTLRSITLADMVNDYRAQKGGADYSI